MLTSVAIGYMCIFIFFIIDVAGWFKGIEISQELCSYIENHRFYQCVSHLPGYISMNSIDSLDYDDITDNNSYIYNIIFKTI